MLLMLPYVAHTQKSMKYKCSKHIFDFGLHSQKNWGLIKSIIYIHKSQIKVYSLCLSIICLNAHKNGQSLSVILYPKAYAIKCVADQSTS